MSKFYITTTLPYINADPHIGFAMEIIQADVLARWHRQNNEAVFFNTGTDEHGLKVWRKSLELGLEVKEYCDQQVKKWQRQKELLNLSFDNFIRTTDEHHIKAAQEFWRRCRDNGYIVKKKYKIKYCVGCELEKTESDLENGRCPLHPNQELEIIEEENYFFAFSRFQEKLLALYKNNPRFVLPEGKLNEIKKFVEMGLQDFSISRLKDKMPWGIEVPDDPKQVMYVWFDALINYISALGWPASAKAGDRLNDLWEFWPGTQIAGKDNLRQQSAMWQAMLMAAGLPCAKQILIHGFINVNGQKMSKSLGNVISPEDLVKKFGVDGTRYLLLTLGSFGEDADITMERLVEKYNGDLANGLGNLVSRVVTLNAKIKNRQPEGQIRIQNFGELLGEAKFKEALDKIWSQVSWANKYIEERKLWELVKNNEPEAKKILDELLSLINGIAEALLSFLPETAGKIKKILETGEATILFPRV